MNDTFEATWVIFNRERGLFWGHNQHGYTALLHAGLYTEAEAVAICARAAHHRRDSQDPWEDVPVPYKAMVRVLEAVHD